jgi:hypothetical protein
VQGVLALALVVFGAPQPQRAEVDGRLHYAGFLALFPADGNLIVRIAFSAIAASSGPSKCRSIPLTPMLFCGVCAYMLWSSLNYAGWYSWIGLAVLVAGVPLLIAVRPRATINDRRARLRGGNRAAVVQQQT